MGPERCVGISLTAREIRHRPAPRCLSGRLPHSVHLRSRGHAVRPSTWLQVHISRSPSPSGLLGSGLFSSWARMRFDRVSLRASAAPRPQRPSPGVRAGPRPPSLGPPFGSAGKGCCVPKGSVPFLLVPPPTSRRLILPVRSCGSLDAGLGSVFLNSPISVSSWIRRALLSC